MRRVLENVDKEYVEDFTKYQEGVDRKKPIPSMKRYDVHKYKDNFYVQLINMLKASQSLDGDILRG